MCSSWDSARTAELDDVILSIAMFSYGENTTAIRLHLEQLAFENKPYVDLSLDDAMWIIRTLAGAVERVATTQSGRKV